MLTYDKLFCRASGSCADDAWAPDMEAVKEGDEEGSPEQKTLAEMSALSFRPSMPSSPPATLTQVSIAPRHHNVETVFWESAKSAVFSTYLAGLCICTSQKV